MLRASARHLDHEIDLAGVGSVVVDSGVAGSAEIGALAEAVVLRDEVERDISVERCVGAVGAEATARAIAVAGNFEMMNRLLDAAGVGPTVEMRSIGDLIGVPLPERFLPRD
ncbi:MAG: hypothetical protein AAF945_07585 [Actinomycetota bacterium]